MSLQHLKNKLDALYEIYNQPGYVHPDPLEFLYEYQHIADREIAALIAASLAYGRVAQILKSVAHVLNIMGPSPSSYIKNATVGSLKKDFTGFVHRFATDDNIVALLLGMKQVIATYGTLYNCLSSELKKKDKTILPALTIFARNLVKIENPSAGHLIPLPERGSACKRLNLFLRWMVRKDAVDPGGWDEIPVSKLIIPLDVHMYRAGVLLGFTNRKHANMSTVLEVTAGFRKLVPRDPVKYDFAITRLGIRGDQDLTVFLKSNQTYLKFPSALNQR